MNVWIVILLIIKLQVTKIKDSLNIKVIFYTYYNSSDCKQKNQILVADRK